MIQNDKSSFWLAAALALSSSVASVFFFRIAWKKFATLRATRSMQPDFEGHYDMDGVSYDTSHHDVVIATDHRVHNPSGAFENPQLQSGVKSGEVAV